MTAAAPGPGRISDEEIVAFLDGQLNADREGEIAMAAASDPALAKRIEEMSPDLGTLREGMEALLDQTPDLPMPEASRAANENRRPWSMMQISAAAVVMFAVGLGAGAGLFHGDSATDWHQAVAEYQVLYTQETVTGTPLPAALRTQGLARVGTRFGLALTEDVLTVDGLGFQRAQMLEFEGSPLGQIVFLDSSNAPIALCLMDATGGVEALADATISGLSATTWSDGRHTYIVIGPTEQATIRKAAEDLRLRLSI